MLSRHSARTDAAPGLCATSSTVTGRPGKTWNRPGHATSSKPWRMSPIVIGRTVPHRVQCRQAGTGVVATDARRAGPGREGNGALPAAPNSSTRSLRGVAEVFADMRNSAPIVIRMQTDSGGHIRLGADCRVPLLKIPAFSNPIFSRVSPR